MFNKFNIVYLFLLPLTSILLPLPCLYAEDVKITTYYPSPYGSYKQLQVQNSDDSTTLTDFTQSLVKSGLNIITDYQNTAYTPGIFWSTLGSLDNPDKPKAGIWMYEATAGSKLLFGTSNNYGTGITNNGLVLDQAGNVGIGTSAPAQRLTVQGTLGILEGGASPFFHTIFQGSDQAEENVTYSLPATQGAANTILTNNGAGVLTWTT